MAPNTLEKGHVCFFYRPKVDVDEAHSINDVQRMFMVLIPFMVRPSVSEEPIQSYFHQVIDNNQPEADKPIPGKIRVIAISKKKSFLKLKNILNFGLLWIKPSLIWKT